MSRPAPHRPPWFLVGRDQAVLCLLFVLLLLAAGYRYVSPRWAGDRRVRKLEAGQRIDYRVDLNKATAAELDLLPGIGPAKASRIIEYREAHGPFRRLSDLAKVGGISRDCIQKLRGLVVPDDGPLPGDTPR